MYEEKIYCYNCFKPIKEGEKTREHIPAKTLFEGYDDKYKVNRITVPACYECNQGYSPTDKDFRNLIGVIAKRKENNQITDKAITSIIKDKNSSLTIDSLGKVTGIILGQDTIENFHKKNFKGLFYHQYGKPLSDEYELFVNIDENDYSEMTLAILGYLKELFIWKHSGHEDILSYCLQPFRLKISNPNKENLKLSENENIIVGYMKYNQEHATLVIAVRKSYLETIKEKHK